MDRTQFESIQTELKDKISVVTKFVLSKHNSPEDLSIYQSQIKTFGALKKRNATVFSKQQKQVQLLLNT